MNLVESRGLRLGYGSRALAPCPDFAVGAGDCLAVVGPNGAGKTTLLKCIAGILQPLEGSLALAPGLTKGGIGYLPQNPPLQRDFPASVREVVQSGCQALRGWRPFYTRAEKSRAEAAMERLGVAPLAGRCYRELSGGQRQRVLIARALSGDCRLLLLDEPTTGLDPEAVAGLYRVLHSIHCGGIAIVMVSHDLPGATRCATHLLTLGDAPSFRKGGCHV